MLKETPGLDNKPFTIKLDTNWLTKNDICNNSNGQVFEIVELPYRKWYQVVFQYFTLGLYKAGYYYKVNLLKPEIECLNDL